MPLCLRRVVLLAALSLLLLPGTALLQPTTFEIHLETEQLVYADGSVLSIRQVRDPRTGQRIPLEHSFLAGASWWPAASAPLPAIIARQSSLWRKGARLRFGYTPDLKRQRKLFKRLFRRADANRGHRDVPKTTGPRGRHAVQDLGDPEETRDQLNWDERNTVAMTGDNCLLDVGDPPSPNDPVHRRWKGEHADCTWDGQRWICPYFIVDCDLYFRATESGVPGFFDSLPAWQQEQLIVAGTKFCHGHEADTWAHGPSTLGAPEIDDTTLADDDSFAWRQIREMDEILYAEQEGYARPGRRARAARQPLLAPIAGAAIDLDRLGPAINQFLATDLKGFTARDGLQVEVFRGESTDDRDLIVRDNGYSLDWDLLDNINPTYRASHVYVGRDKITSDLRRALDSDGGPETIRGVEYASALRVTVRVTGRWERNGADQTITRTYWIYRD